jgi:transposase
MEHHLLVEGRCVSERLEVLEGPTGRRVWPDEVKGRIVAESFAPGARVVDVARRHGLKAQHLSGWRSQARRGKLVVPVDEEPVFAALELAAETKPAPVAIFVEIEVSGVVIRLPVNSSGERIAEIVSALSDRQ